MIHFYRSDSLKKRQEINRHELYRSQIRIAWDKIQNSLLQRTVWDVSKSGIIILGVSSFWNKVPERYYRNLMEYYQEYAVSETVPDIFYHFWKVFITRPDLGQCI